MDYTRQELWGGAITTELPKGLMDASQLRQVPDAQEVFLVPTENTDNYKEMNKHDTVIFDLLERVDGADVDAVKVHFEDIAHLNDTDEWTLFSIDEAENTIKPKTSSFVGVGVEPAKKWGRDESKGLDFTPALVIVLGVVRLAKVETDLLVSYNVPLNTADELKSLHDLLESGTSLSKDNDDNIAQKRLQLGMAVVKDIIKKLKVEDWGLFG